MLIDVINTIYHLLIRGGIGLMKLLRYTQQECKPNLLLESITSSNSRKIMGLVRCFKKSLKCPALPKSYHQKTYNFFDISIIHSGTCNVFLQKKSLCVCESFKY